jgi:hypothetical protein
MKHVPVPGAKLDGNDTAGRAIVDQEIDDMVLVEESHFVLDALLVEGLQDHVSGAVGGVTGTTHRFFSEIAGVPAEATLADAPFWCSVEGQAHVLQLDNRIDRFLGQYQSRILIGQIITAFYGVISVPQRFVFFQVAQGCANPTQRRPLCWRTARPSTPRRLHRQ